MGAGFSRPLAAGNLETGRLVGILSMRDLLRVEIDERDEAIAQLNAYVHYVPPDLTPTRSASGT